jgi:RHS repeat-associated protein
MIWRVILLWLLVVNATTHSLAIARPTGYGAVPGYRPVAYGNGVDFQKSSVWRGHEVDVTGYYHLGMRDYDPVSGQWLSYDPFWNALDPNGQSYCGGDPVNFTDPDGLMTAQTMQTAGRQATTAAAFIDDQIVNVFAGSGYLMHESLGIAQQLTGGDPSTFYAQANQYQGYLSPYARQGYYNLNSPFTKIATAATIFVPGSAAGRVGTVESTLASEASATTIAGEQTVVKQQQLLLPAPSQPLALIPENAQSLVAKGGILGPAGPGQFVLRSGQRTLETAGVVRTGGELNRVFDSRWPLGRPYSQPMGGSFSPGSTLPNSASQAIIDHPIYLECNTIFGCGEKSTLIFWLIFRCCCNHRFGSATNRKTLGGLGAGGNGGQG